jgi:hypothetical protein
MVEADKETEHRIYHDLLENMDASTQIRVRAHENFETGGICDPAALMKICKDVCQTNRMNGVEPLSIRDKLSMARTLEALRQGKGEDILLYHKRFLRMHEDNTRATCEPRSDEALAQLFEDSLDRIRYAPMLTSLASERAAGRDPEVNTLAKIFKYAQRKASSIDGPTQAAKAVPLPPARVMVATDGSTADQIAAATAALSVLLLQGAQGQAATGGKTGGAASGKLGGRKCFNCQGDHLQRDCPLNSASGATGNRGPAQTQGDAPKGKGKLAKDAQRPPACPRCWKGSHPVDECRNAPPTGACVLCGSDRHIHEACNNNPNRTAWAKWLLQKGPRTLVITEGQGETDAADSNFATFLAAGPLRCGCGEATIASASVLAFQDGDILLDNAAGTSVCLPRVCTQLKPLAKPRSVGGINAAEAPMVINTEGIFAELGLSVLADEHATVSVVSKTQLIDKGYDVDYNKANDEYHVRCANGTFLYFRRRKLADGTLAKYYAYNKDEPILQRNFIATVSDNLRQYTAREVRDASKARELQETLGCGVAKLMEMVRAGIQGSDVTCQDIQRAEALWGPSISGLKANTTKHKSTSAGYDLAPRKTQVQQLIELDVIWLKGIPFLLALVLPLGLAMVEHLRDRSAALIGKCVNRMLSSLKARDFDVTELRTDNEGGVAKHKTALEYMGIRVEPCGPGQHVPGIERLARTVKERVRAYDTTLPFVMCAKLLIMCVISVVIMINWVPNSQSLDRTSPSERFTGRKLNALRDLRGQFGEYTQCTTPNTDNTMTARTQGCIYGYPTGNLTGTVAMYQLSTGQRVLRDQMTKLPMPTEVEEHLNQLAAADGLQRGIDPGVPRVAQPRAWPDFPLPDMMPFGGGVMMNPPDEEEEHAIAAEGHHEIGVDYAPDQHHDEIEQQRPAGVDTTARAPAAVGVVPPAAEAVAAPAAEAVAPPAAEPAVQRPQYPAASRHGVRVDPLQSLGSKALLTIEQARQDPLLHELWRRRHWHDTEFAFHISVRAAMKARPAETEPAMEKELQQMIDKNVWHPVRFESLTPVQRRATLRSSMFMKLKYLASGLFDKLKARLVAGGDQQDKSLYENLSAPTAATSSVFTVAAIAASEGRIAATMDIGGAFLNAKMDPDGVLVHMRLDKLMTSLLAKLKPEYARHIASDGTMVVQLDRALYGTVEAAALWHADLTTRLKTDGYVENPYDPCVYNKTGDDGVQITIVIHVDDLLVTSANQTHIDALHRNLKEAYPAGADGSGGIAYKTGQVLDYVGLTLDFRTAGEVAITMVNAINEILETCGVETTSATPAASCLFDVREGVELASADMAKWFHSNVAKVLHVSKRVLPECLTSVSFLSTRVQACDIDDLAKLRRLLGYIRANRTRGIILRIGEHMGVKSFIDAAYGVHTSSGRSHTGCAIVLGEAGPVYVKSGKQKIVTKSSTEAELVAMSDSTSQAIHLRNFVTAQGYDMGPAIIYQDNMSTMALMKRGGPCSERSRHIDIRHFWVAERVANHEVRIEHLGTAEMFSNVLTKPVQGAQFLRERLGLTNWP